MTRPFLTVLTTPITSTRVRIYRGIRGAARAIVRPGRPRPVVSPFPGHGALVRSVVEGLRAIGADFNFNPARLGVVGRVVYAPANEALRQAIELKRRGRIEWLVAGPVNALSPHECGGILLSPEIDLVIVASEWVRDLYRSEAPALNDKVRICQSGVDPEYWKPSAGARGERALVYWKDAPEWLCLDVERFVQSTGLDVLRMRYGDYDRETFKRNLAEARVAVFLSTFETQGLALAEAWAMDVPTLVWNPRAPTEWRGRPFTAGSSCPFLAAATGRSWETLPELSTAMDEVLNARETFAPRVWLLSHMTDAICAAALYRIIRESAGRR